MNRQIFKKEEGGKREIGESVLIGIKSCWNLRSSCLVQSLDLLSMIVQILMCEDGFVGRSGICVYMRG